MIDSRTDASADTRLPEPSNKARRSASIIVALLAVATALHFGADFFIPVTFGLVLTGVLWPVVKKLERWHIPTPAGAAISVLGAGAILVAVITAFGPPLRAFSNELPRTIAAARPKLAAISTALARYTSPQPRRRTTPAATTKPKTKADSMAPPPADSGVIAVMKSAVAAVTDSQAAPATDSAGKAQRKPETADSVRTPRTRVATPAAPAQGTSTAGAIPSSITSGAPATITHALSVALGMLADFVEVVLFALFILALSNHWSDKLAIAIPNAERRAGVADAINEMRSVVSRFLVVISLINIVQASIVAFSLYLLGYPSELLWGVSGDYKHPEQPRGPDYLRATAQGESGGHSCVIDALVHDLGCGRCIPRRAVAGGVQRARSARAIAQGSQRVHQRLRAIPNATLRRL